MYIPMQDKVKTGRQYGRGESGTDTAHLAGGAAVAPSCGIAEATGLGAEGQEGTDNDERYYGSGCDIASGLGARSQQVQR